MSQSVAAAILSFTEIAPGQHRSFNEWHRYDHQPELQLVEGIVTGTRLVATPALQASRFARDPAMAATQYFGFYLLADPVAQTLQAIGAMGAKMRELARWRDRRGPSTLCQITAMRSSGNVVSDPRVMPFRPYRGLYVTVHDPLPGAAQTDLDADFADHEDTTGRGLLDVPGVAGCWSFRFAGASAVAGMTAEIPNNRAIRVYWLDCEPEPMLADLNNRAAVQSPHLSKGYDLVFTSAYQQITPGSSFDWFDDIARNKQ